MARKTDTVTLADGRKVPIRQLSWLQLRASRQIAQQESARHLVAMGGAEFLDAWAAMQARKGGPEADPQAPVAVGAPDLLAGHDLLTVLVGGIPSFTMDQIESLDEPAPEVLGRAILALTPAPRTEEQEGNAPAPSISA